MKQELTLCLISNLRHFDRFNFHRFALTSSKVSTNRFLGTESEYIFMLSFELIGLNFDFISTYSFSIFLSGRVDFTHCNNTFGNNQQSISEWQIPLFCMNIFRLEWKLPCKYIYFCSSFKLLSFEILKASMEIIEGYSPTKQTPIDLSKN